MSLYGKTGSSGLEQTLYFPNTPLTMSCEPGYCNSTQSSWVSPTSWEDPSSPQKATAQLRVVVENGLFYDTYGQCAEAIPQHPEFDCFY
jgi:hypothetical protein